MCAAIHWPSAGHRRLDRVHRHGGPREDRLEHQEQHDGEQHEAPDRMHDDRVDAVLEAPHCATRPARRSRGCAAPRPAGRPTSAPRAAGRRWRRSTPPRRRHRPRRRGAPRAARAARHGRRRAPRPSRRPGSRARRRASSTSIFRPSARATSAMLSATISGRPSRVSSSTRRRFMRRLVASTTATIASGAGLAVAPALDDLERDLLVGRRRRQAVGAGQVDDRARCGRSSGRVRPTLRSTVTPA